MHYKSALIVVSSIDISRKFYEDILHQKVLFDFGENVAFDGFSLQEKKLWSTFIENPHISFGGNDAELYFEEDKFDDFVEVLRKEHVQIISGPMTHSWGQRVVRFVDPDMHIIEVAESMEFVCRRFLSSGMSVDEVAKISQHPEEFVRRCLVHKGD